ncbi:hypothetical protein [Marinilabilia sp.]|uniref:hypothetical protein n=1 Tax=Marinilabilia sp. TaxID=2021252 RepID=UPI0025C635CD|nr:hypothetical protein [Marinilabilia sp.]
MKSKKLPQKHNNDFDAFEKPKKSGANVSKSKRSKKPSIYDELDDLGEMDDFVLSDREYRGFDDLYSDDDDALF